MARLRIKSLKINNLRNLGSVEITAHPQLNLFLGDNGAGKTSVLEALIVLAKGRSFRSSRIAALIGPDGPALRVVVDLEADGGSRHRLGLERSRSGWRARRDGENVDRFSTLGHDLPLVLMEPDSHELVAGAPETRRRHLDWGVFHVEPRFLDTWRRYDRALRQRNAALRRGQPALLDALDPQLLEAGDALGAQREDQAQRLSTRLSDILPTLGPELPPIEVSYHPGHAQEGFADDLAVHRKRDLERGQTQVGPHRADLVLKTPPGLARERLSRGEQKVLAAALLLAQAELLAAGGKAPVLLLDDLASELDAGHQARVLGWGLERGWQTWVTGVGTLSSLRKKAPEHAVFHVEHGEVSTAD